MTASARLRELRLVGFKSFAERTTIEFRTGINAIVGPNGSGKSNLADALRWALGEQGRGLRTRRAEDVIFAGSARRQAIGMADVTLLIDNADGLLPLDFAEVELGRRLFRSGENEYLVNRQRVRLRDLAELLESANLADNAFLFIGQGMVDQALALRPEERRPLFEEVAGVRRHERRRRRAEAELMEAEDNIGRVRDVLAELRPQARRLKAQVEQDEARQSAAKALAGALILSAQARWAVAGTAERTAAQTLAAARRGEQAERSRLEALERSGAALAEEAGAAGARERAARAAAEQQRQNLSQIRLEEAGATARLEAVAEERDRALRHREEAEAQAARADAEGMEAAPDGAADLAVAAATLERELAAATAILADADAADRESGERERAVRRHAAERAATLERQRREAAEAARRSADQAERLVAARRASTEHEEARASAAAALAAGVARAEEAEAALERVQARLDIAQEARAAAFADATLRSAEAATIDVRTAAARDALSRSTSRELEEAAAASGGEPVAATLPVEPPMQAAAEAALGEATRGVIVPAAAVAGLRAMSGVLLIADGDGAADAAAAESIAAARALGGGLLSEQLSGPMHPAVRRLLARTLWLPDLEGALEFVDALLPGWSVVTPAGEWLGADGVVRLATQGSLLALRREVEELKALRSRASAASDAATARLKALDGEVRTAVTARGDAQQSVHRLRGELRPIEERVRVTSRRADEADRQARWEAAQAERLAAAAERASQTLAQGTADADRAGGGEETASARGPGAPRPTDDLEDLRTRVHRLRTQHAQVRAELERAEQERARAEDRRMRAEVQAQLRRERLQELDALAEALARRSTAAETVRQQLHRRAEAAGADLEAALTDLQRVEEEVSSARGRLAGKERALSAARDRTEAAARRTAVAEMTLLQERLELDAVREQLLVELATLGPACLHALTDGPSEPGGVGGEAVPEDALPDLLAGALERATKRWSVDPGPVPEEPTNTRLALLRRRYHELGVSNPFAAAEFAELATRVSELESQRADLERAILETRRLVGQLSELIASQFRATFAALEGAFGRRFQQLFDGGEARLSMTEPDDLATTGIEITARPPGKKRQPLQMLSGGERALTAVALLFAMLEVRPVPFCVLDEVDAALDEANISRFAGALRDLAATIQFIVITHNRGTIEASDALHGVTIGEDAVSRVISLRLTDADHGPVPEPVALGLGR